MSYRTMVNDFQIFGNNESYQEWIDFIQSQGVEVDDDGCYDGYIYDFMGAVETIEKIIIRLNSQREKLKSDFNGKVGVQKIQSYFDFTDRIERVANQDESETHGYSLLDELFMIVNETYAFIPYAFYLACKDDLVKDHVYTTKNHFFCFKIKEGAKIHVKAS